MNKYDKALKANNAAFCNCFQAFYNQIGHLQARHLYKQAMRETRQLKKVSTTAPSYRTPYVLPVLDENITRHLEWATVDVKPYIDALGMVFASNKIGWSLAKVTQGPTLTQIKVSLTDFRHYDKAMRLERQFQAAMNIPGVRIAQSGAYISIEVPCFIDALRVGDVLHDEKFEKSNGLTVAIGRAIDGENVLADIDKLKHILVAGASGSGKSVFVQGMIVSLLAKHTPDDIDIYMVDPKMVEFSFYKGLAQCHVVTETKDAVELLNNLTKMMDDRYRELSAAGCRDIESYNEKYSDHKMKRVVLFIDELADLIKTSKKSVETSIVRIAQKARACGIHLVIATQYPVADVVTGLIKQNMPTKVCFTVTSATASCVMLGRGGAEKLMGKGDMLYQTEKDVNPIRLQAGLIEEKEINNIVYSLMQNRI